MYCPSCGVQASEGDAFCRKCGKALGVVIAHSPAPAPVQSPTKKPPLLPEYEGVKLLSVLLVAGGIVVLGSLGLEVNGDTLANTIYWISGLGLGGIVLFCILFPAIFAIVVFLAASKYLFHRDRK